MGPGGPGGTPPKNNSKLFLIIGAAVLALVIIGIGAAVLVNRSADTAGPADPQQQQSQSSAPVVAAKASDAVKAYLEALAAGKADAALALGNDQPADKTFLTDAVLADSNSRAPITEINVPEVNDEYTYSVDASYKLGDEPVTEKYSVSKSGAGWKIRTAFVEMNLTYVRAKTLPLTVNKVPVKTDKIRVFPGSYAFSSGNKYVGYGDETALLVKSPTTYASTSDLRPTLTEAGADAFVAAAKVTLGACTKSKVLAPPGCPNAIRQASYQKIDAGSISWKLDPDALVNAKPRLDYENPAVVTTSESVAFQFAATGTEFDRAARFSRTLTTYAKLSANLTQEPLKVTFVP
jgi:hypothetical protein